MNRRLFCTGLVASMLTFSIGAQAIDRDFTVVNRTGEQITQLFASPTRTTTWGSDILGADVLDDGASVDIHYTPSMYRGQCVFDIMIVDTDGGQHVVNAINLCTISTVTFTVSRGQVVYRAE